GGSAGCRYAPTATVLCTPLHRTGHRRRHQGTPARRYLLGFRSARGIDRGADEIRREPVRVVAQSSRRPHRFTFCGKVVAMVRRLLSDQERELFERAMDDSERLKKSSRPPKK